MSFENLKAIADAAKDRATAKRQDRISRHTALGWRYVWDDAMREFFPEVRITYSGTEANLLKQAIKGRGLAKEDLNDFIRWFIQHWNVLRREVFSRDKRFPKGPEYPVMKWVIMNLSEIHAKYTATKAEVKASLPLAARATPRPVAPAPAPAAPRRVVIPKPAPIVLDTPKQTFDRDKAEEARKRLGLPKWSAKP